MNAAEYLIQVRRALHLVGMGWSAYVCALAITSGRANTIAGLAAITAISCKGTRDILTRRSAAFFQPLPGTDPQRYTISPYGIETLERIRRKLPATKPARNTSTPSSSPTSRQAQLLLEL